MKSNFLITTTYLMRKKNLSSKNGTSKLAQSIGKK